MDPKPLTIEVVLGFWGVWGGTPRGVWGPRLADSRDPGPSGPVRGATLPIFLRKPAKTTHFWHFWGCGVPPRGVWGPRLAESRDPGPPEGRPCQFFSKTGQNTHFWHWGCGGYPPGGSGPPGWQNPGTRGLLRRSEGATPPTNIFGSFGGLESYLQGSQAGRFQGPEASWACPRGRPPGFWAGPRPTCPLSCPETQKVVLCRLSSNPYRVREAKCLLGALTSCRAAGTGREDPQPDNLRFTVKRTFSAKLRGEAESKKAPLRGVGG